MQTLNPYGRKLKHKKDNDVIMQRIRSARVQTFSATGGPVFIGPVTRSFFATNPDGFWAEFMDHNMKKRP
jgi:hypothetical protein